MSQLTEREKQIVLLRLSAGLTTKQTAEKTGLAVGTVKQYMHSAYAKLGPAAVNRVADPEPESLK